MNTGGVAQAVQGTLGTVQDLVNAAVPRHGPGLGQNGAQSPVAQGHSHHHGGYAGSSTLPPPLAGMQAGVAQVLGQSQASPPQGAMQAGQPGVVPRGDIAQHAATPLRGDAAHLAIAQPQRGGESVPAPALRADVAPASPLRPDALPPAPRSDAVLAERMAALQRAPAAPMALPANTAANTMAAATTVAGATLAAATAPSALPAAPSAQAVDARNVPGLTMADRGQGVRAEVMNGTYTGEGPQRRALRRGARVLPGGLSALLGAIGAQGRTQGEGRDARTAERERQAAAMQWLFWLLAVIAYGCVAFAVVGLMPTGGGTGGAASIAGRGWTGGFAIAGLVAAVGAWWFARHMARGDAGARPKPPRDGD